MGTSPQTQPYYYMDYPPDRRQEYLDHQLLLNERERRHLLAQREEERRRWILEEKREEEHSRRLLAQKKREEEHRRRLLAQKRREEEHRRRLLLQQRIQQEEKEKEIRRLRQQKQLEEQRYLQQKREAMKQQKQPRYQIIRGPDGNLYYFLTKENNVDKQMMDRQGIKPKSSFNNDAQESKFNDSSRVPISGLKQNLHTNTTTVHDEMKNDTKNTLDEPNKKLRVKRVSSILIGEVEDASDDESEDFSKSVWRNRRPAEGLWIEPVEGVTWM